MTSGNTMRVDPMVALQEASVREEFLKHRTLVLAQQLELTKQQHKALLEKVDGLEADLRLARADVIEGEQE